MPESSVITTTNVAVLTGLLPLDTISKMIRPVIRRNREAELLILAEWRKMGAPKVMREVGLHLDVALATARNHVEELDTQDVDQLEEQAELLLSFCRFARKNGKEDARPELTDSDYSDVPDGEPDEEHDNGNGDAEVAREPGPANQDIQDGESDEV